ncbi:MAG: hypothetical protein ACU0BB_14515 [Paracoccaceae bacterium]
MHKLTSDRFHVEAGTRVFVQVPEADAQRVLDAILTHDPLGWGEYDQVSFTTAIGTQKFRVLPSSRNAATENMVSVPCVELQFFTTAQEQALEPILCAIYDAHPYEEPVVQMIAAHRTRHISGLDEENPNRFWNRENADWVPEQHRSS